MERVEARKLKPVTKQTKGLLVVLGLFSLFYGVSQLSWYAAAGGVLILLVVVFSKQTVVDETGIVMTSRIGPIKSVDAWPFCILISIHAERKAGSPFVALHFSKGTMNKMLLFDPSDVDKVISMAKRANSGITCGEIPEKS